MEGSLCKFIQMRNRQEGAVLTQQAQKAQVPQRLSSRRMLLQDQRDPREALRVCRKQF